MKNAKAYDAPPPQPDQLNDYSPTLTWVFQHTIKHIFSEEAKPMLPFSYDGTIVRKLPIGQAESPEEVVFLIQKAIRRYKPRYANVSGDTLEIRGGMFRLVTNLNLLVPITCAVIRCHQEERCIVISYHLTFGEGLLATIAGMVLILGGFIPVFLSIGAPTFFAFFLPVLWILVYIANISLGIVRFKGFLERTLTPSTPGAIS